MREKYSMQTPFISPYQPQEKKHYFFRYCAEDKGGCGEKFVPTVTQQKLCDSCKAKIWAKRRPYGKYTLSANKIKPRAITKRIKA
jgi:hypothetical protein